MFDELQDWKHFLFGLVTVFIGRLIYDHYVEQKIARRNGKGMSIAAKIQQGNPAERWDGRMTIPDGQAGTVATLAVMKKIVNRDSSDPHIRGIAEQIVRGCRGHDFLCEIKACFAFVRDQITYRRDPLTTEYVQDSRRTLESGVGDCDCKVVLLCSLLQALGHKTKFIVIGSGEEFTHVYCAVFSRQHGWIPLDPTNERAPIGWEAQASLKASFPVWVN